MEQPLPTQQLIRWLHDAHAMEEAQVDALSSCLADTSGLETVRGKLVHHLESTLRHAVVVRDCLERCGGTPREARTGPAAASHMIGGAVVKSAEDQPLRDLLSAYATEHYEIAAYTLLIEGAMRSGHGELIPLLEEVLEEEEEMADWIEDQLPRLAQIFIKPVATA